MFDLGGTELLVIAIVALIVVGPKDLPVLFRKVGQFVGKAKGMAREFSRAMDEAADDAGIKETADSLRKIAEPKKMGLDAVKDATDGFKNWEPGSDTAALAEDRAEAAKKIHKATAKKAEQRLEAEAAKAKESSSDAAKKSPSKAATAKKSASKPAATKSKTTSKATSKAKAPSKKASSGKTANAKPASKTATKKTTAKKPSTKSSGTKA